MSKYYTPSIEEFHVGFECEMRNSGVKPIIWETHQLTKAQTTQIIRYCDLRGVEESGIRVKYLDKEDIESLGFKFSYTYEGVDDYTKLRQDSKEPYWEDDYYYIHFNPNDKWLEIDNDQSYDDLVTYFQGTIKNKSELKKLLKQLGINE